MIDPNTKHSLLVSVGPLCKRHSSCGFCKLVWNPASNSNTNILSKQPFFSIGKISPKVETQNSSFQNEVIFGGNNFIAIHNGEKENSKNEQIFIFG
jgi:hypothetical protein